jgi:hypothetical protein
MPREARNQTGVNPLKTNNSAKSSDFAPNDFKDLWTLSETADFAQRNDPILRLNDFNDLAR